MAACSGSVSGAVHATYTCALVMAVLDKSTNVGAFTVNLNGTPPVAIGISFPGAPVVKTYTNTDAGAVGGISILSGKSAWMAAVGKKPTQGSYSLKLTSVTAGSTMGPGTYTVHGTLTATLPPMAGSSATGNAMVSITF
jgi:hypothetical protein